ncbi:MULTISPECIES: xanthine dehydrogenase family protein molybdopterin-binding subunit [Streptomyces]|uniref:Xanthine dehydrogenase family protein molybdopterin-binding subunit n=1 Tax=Streptomyces dengpaensis TaxID=2049881 RepID=A0ABM6T0M6_9ACTN|nr:MULTISPECIES: xanthine dehydrogenase family protein molybdopterin-binding subunit [Streptomyces]AVH60375.1 xanthine dehydrogenase family protein molybdopterin-binding subunit [Streptomyces dengpaensis]PIB06617.1 acylaldehyde oxidase [Streptomyces sp. HG99]
MTTTVTPTTTYIGQAVSRVDGQAKVTGQATYAAEFDPGPRMTYGVVVGSTIANGRITSIDTAAAESAPGVVAVMTHANAPRLPYHPCRSFIDAQDGEPIHVLQDDRVLHHGQAIALVVAETFEEATYAATLVHASYAEEPAATSFEVAALRAVPPGPGNQQAGMPGDTQRGDPDIALRTAEVKVDATYEIAREDHNPIELFATTAAWDAGTLTLWIKTQWVSHTRAYIAATFGIRPEDVEVISPFVGGAFGSALSVWPHTVIAAMGARHVDRPVKVVLTRRQGFPLTGYRPYTAQRVALGADRSGNLVSIHHEGTAVTSAYERFAENLLGATRFLYRCPNVATRYRLAEMNVGTPTSMRAPGEISGLFALESALDELAEALDIDPVELRLRNDADRDLHRDLPFSSRNLRECLIAAAERFGWQGRDPRVGSMRDEQGRLIGYGCSSATYPVYNFPASARAVLHPDGSADVSSATSDMGPGTYTSMTQVAAETLGLPIEQVRFELGDASLPQAPPHGGSATMGGVGSAVYEACTKARRQALERAGETNGDVNLAQVMRRLGQSVEATADYRPSDESNQYSMHSYGAVFAEVRVDPDLGLVRVPRVVSAFGGGRIVNPKLAHSQAIGGIVMGIGMALLEHTAVDPRDGHVVNGSLADYLVPVNADIGELDPFFVQDDDPHVNPLGVKGIAEIAAIGVAPAITNAVYHATGVRVRTLPVTPEMLLSSRQG